MSPRRVHRLFAVALVFSVLIHIALLMLIGSAIRESRWQDEVARVRALPKFVPVDLSLGIDAPTPPTDTWIGYEKEIPQRAQPAEVEQAAFTDDPVAAAPPPPSPTPESQQPSPPVTETPESPSEPQQEPHDIPAEPVPPPSSPEPPDEQSPPAVTLVPPEEQAPPAPPPIPELDESTTGDLPLAEQTSTDRPTGPNAAELTKWFQEMAELLEQAAQESDSAPTSQPAPSPPPSPPSESAALPDQPVARQPDQSTPNTGAQSDKESDPSSIIDVPRDQWELGKPLAAHGLELKPRRPHFTVLTMLTSAPCNPSCEITFGKDGVPTRARLLSGSCDSRVDEAILNSLYGWRASGQRLTKLPEGETIKVNIRLILSRRK